MGKARKPNYEKYIASTRWARKRRRKLREAEYRCRLCGVQESLEVHHLTYIRLGREMMADLMVLCRGCHQKHHDEGMPLPPQSFPPRVPKKSKRRKPWQGTPDYLKMAQVIHEEWADKQVGRVVKVKQRKVRYIRHPPPPLTEPRVDPRREAPSGFRARLIGNPKDQPSRQHDPFHI